MQTNCTDCAHFKVSRKFIATDKEGNDWWGAAHCVQGLLKMDDRNGGGDRYFRTNFETGKKSVWLLERAHKVANLRVLKRECLMFEDMGVHE
jgi:hypothetical protein